MALHPDLIELVRCPKCRGRLALRATASAPEGFECSSCRLLYPVTDDIPQLLVEEAKPLEV